MILKQEKKHNKEQEKHNLFSLRSLSPLTLENIIQRNALSEFLG